MQLNTTRLKLTSLAANTAKTEGDKLYLGQSVDPSVLQQLYPEKINTSGTAERAFYMAANSNTRLPSVHDLLLSHLRV